MAMKKQLAVLTALAALGVGAQAQSNVELVGTIDTYIGSIRMAGDAGKVNEVGSGGMTTPWFGFKGSEDLGGGLKANFALTSFFQSNNGQDGRFTGDPFFSRDANVGLSGGFGSVSMGRGLAPNFLPTVIFNPFGDSFTFSPLVLHADVPLFNASNWQSTVPSDTGWANELIYSTPNVGGLSGNLHYQLSGMASGSGQSGKSNAGFNALYFAGPLALTAYYERDQINDPIATVFSPADTRKDWMVGGSYDFAVVKAYLTYGQSTSLLMPKASTTSVGASVPAGGGKVMADYAQTAISGGKTRRTTSVGYDYNLSKRTDLYAIVMNDRITTYTSGTSVGLGVRHNF